MVLASLAFLAFVLLLFYYGWKTQFRPKVPDDQPFPEKWRRVLLDKVSFYETLAPEERNRFEKEVLYFLDTVTVTGVEVDVTEADRLLVASSGVIPLFGFSGMRYRNISEVLLYEGTFNADYQTEGAGRNILGKVGSGDMHRLMILSLPALRAGFENEKSPDNVGIHEFVHLIDKADGLIDGLPERIMQRQYVIPWLQLVHREIERIKRDESDINPYAATGEVEFLSVASEYFFSQPERFEQKHPDLYRIMTKMYRQEPGDPKG